MDFTNNRAQSAIEFFVLIGAVLFFFVTFLFIVQNNISDNLKERRVAALREAAFSIQDEVALAVASSEGYTRYFTLPNDIQGLNYEINISSGLVYIATIEENYALALPVLNVTGQPSRGDNIIRKNNGSVFLN